MALSRRDLLKLALAGAAHPLLPLRGIVSQAFAAPGAADAKFLLVFLRGGYDAANVLMPVGSELVLRVAADDRHCPTRSGQPRCGDLAGRSGRRARWGLHPALRESMLPLWEKRPARVRAVRRHRGPDAQPLRDAGQRRGRPAGRGAERAARSRGSGFLNRLAGALDGTAAPVSFTDGLPVVMTGDVLGAERVAEGHRPAAVRRSPDRHLLAGHVRRHALRAADRRRLRAAQDRRRAGRR